MVSLGVIPARGGSKGIPLKNIKLLFGKPLIHYSIEEAKKSNNLNRFVVSTDHPEIKEIAQSYNCEVIVRPPELATDEARTEPTLIHALDYLKESEGFRPDIVLTLEPTSPFRTAKIIDRCVKIFSETNADSVIALVPSLKCYGKIINGKFEFLFHNQQRRRQEREPLYKEASTIWGTKTKILRERQSIFGDHLYPLIVDESEAIDINTKYDFKYAEYMMKKLKLHKSEVFKND